MARLLSDWGYSVSACESFIDAVEVCKIRKPDVLISDFHLGEGKNGLETVLHIREKFNSEIPVLLITADTDLMIDTQIPRFILTHKPVRPARLRLMINHLIKQT